MGGKWKIWMCNRKGQRKKKSGEIKSFLTLSISPHTKPASFRIPTQKRLFKSFFSFDVARSTDTHAPDKKQESERSRFRADQSAHCHHHVAAAGAQRAGASGVTDDNGYYSAGGGGEFAQGDIALEGRAYFEWEVGAVG